MNAQDVDLVLNGEPRRVQVRADETLLRTLRDTCDVVSVRGACGIGICGTCTVLLDDKVASSCILLTRQVAGRRVETSEGLTGPNGSLDRVQDAFVRAGAYQCSFCIPAMALTVRACLEERPDADVDTVREYLGGNLCRCGTYPQVLDAVTRLLADDTTVTG
ncbi:MAG: (2Fe-2S)-binding protein [Egibacteraceae bacterium]